MKMIENVQVEFRLILTEFIVKYKEKIVFDFKTILTHAQLRFLFEHF